MRCEYGKKRDLDVKVLRINRQCIYQTMRMYSRPQADPSSLEYVHLQPRFLIAATSFKEDKYYIQVQAFDTREQQLARWRLTLAESDSYDLGDPENPLLHDTYKKRIYLKSDLVHLPANLKFHIYFDLLNGEVKCFIADEKGFRLAGVRMPTGYEPSQNFTYGDKDELRGFLLGVPFSAAQMNQDPVNINEN